MLDETIACQIWLVFWSNKCRPK